MLNIKPSQRNSNKHTEEGMQLLERSIDKVGVIESISVATDGTIISGHARKEVFDKQGKVPKEIRLKENEYPVILTDIENNSKQYFEAQILANTTANKNLKKWIFIQKAIMKLRSQKMLLFIATLRMQEEQNIKKVILIIKNFGIGFVKYQKQIKFIFQNIQRQLILKLF